MSPVPHGDYPHLLLLYHWSCVIIRVVYFRMFPKSFFRLIIVIENIALIKGSSKAENADQEL